MNPKKVKYLVVGSGAGGATVARELCRLDQPVLVIEEGKFEEKVGTFLDAVRYYDAESKLTHIPKKSKEGTIVWRSLMAGGTTMVSMANGVRCLEKELGMAGIHLEEEFSEAERETGVAPIADRLISDGGRRVGEAARLLGYTFQNMPKFIDPQQCKSCGCCSLGCAHGAKWTALKYLEEAQQNGVEVMDQTRVEQVCHTNGQASGVIVKGPGGRAEIEAEVVILAAGGVGTPIILQKSGLTDAGQGLFIDMLVNTYGVCPDFNLLNEPQMALVDLEFHADRGFMLATSINHPREVRLIEAGMDGFLLPNRRLVGIMTKISDEPSGRVLSDGTISKAPTAADQEKIRAGTQIAAEILVKAGAAPKSIVYSIPQGAHPGGTAAIGRIVDDHLMTSVKNLYVCDASVLPVSPGLPPILTIIALGKYLAKELVARR